MKFFKKLLTGTIVLTFLLSSSIFASESVVENSTEPNTEIEYRDISPIQSRLWSEGIVNLNNSYSLIASEVGSIFTANVNITNASYSESPMTIKIVHKNGRTYGEGVVVPPGVMVTVKGVPSGSYSVYAKATNSINFSWYYKIMYFVDDM